MGIDLRFIIGNLAIYSLDYYLALPECSSRVQRRATLVKLSIFLVRVTNEAQIWTKHQLETIAGSQFIRKTAAEASTYNALSRRVIRTGKSSMSQIPYL